MYVPSTPQMLPGAVPLSQFARSRYFAGLGAPMVAPSFPLQRSRASIVIPRSRILRPAAPGLFGFSGLGETGDNATLAKQSGSLASAGLLISAAAVGGPVGAIIAGAAAAVTALTNLFVNVFSGCGQTCIAATQIVDQVESQYLKPNLETYVSQPTRTKAMQSAALQVFDYAWQQVLNGCSNPNLQDAGKRCISDRQQGACTWKAAAGQWVHNSDGSYSWQGWGPVGSGSDCFNWFSGYRDPIANDPGVVDDTTSIGSTLSSGTIAGVPLIDLAIPALLVLAAILL